MSKTIKLKQSDIVQIVSNILKEDKYDDFLTKSRKQEALDAEEEQKEQNQSGFDDFDTQVQPEESPNSDEDMDDAVELGLMVDKEGNHYVIDARNPENPIILAKTD